MMFGMSLTLCQLDTHPCCCHVNTNFKKCRFVKDQVKRERYEYNVNRIYLCIIIVDCSRDGGDHSWDPTRRPQESENTGPQRRAQRPV